MRKLLNTLYVFTEDAYLALENGNVVVWSGDKRLGKIPLLTLDGICSFSRRGASPALMGECGEAGVGLSFFTPSGRYLASVFGRNNGNVLLRREQFRAADDPGLSLVATRGFLTGKLLNCRSVLRRGLSDHRLRVNAERLEGACAHLTESAKRLAATECVDSARGIEGDAAAEYFDVLGELVLRDREELGFVRRTKRPPLDPFNAVLSLFYSVLASDCASALMGAGLDPYVGFLHVDRPGRASLALDVMEELRPLFVDRFVLTAINNQVVTPASFERLESGEVRISDKGRRALFELWQQRKKDVITHPYLGEKMPRGLVPHVQALLLARWLRGDLDGYPPYLAR